MKQLKEHRKVFETSSAQMAHANTYSKDTWFLWILGQYEIKMSIMNVLCWNEWSTFKS